MGSPPESDILLREVTEDDLVIFFKQQQDPAANWMAAFTAKDPTDWAAFAAKWAKILGDGTGTAKTIVCGGRVAGNVLSFIAPWSGQREVSYWVGRDHWGRGVATKWRSPLSSKGRRSGPCMPGPRGQYCLDPGA